MPLILAIDPDKRQSSQLASLVKSQLRAELVHRATAVEALDALNGRVPDLVLTSSLISPREDAALAAHLRDLGAAAAHVQTITIPLLGSAVPQRAKGVLAALRRDKPQTAMTDGCAPDVFAEQIRQYLRTADEQKAGAAALALSGAGADVPQETDAPSYIAVEPPSYLEAETPSYVEAEPPPYVEEGLEAGPTSSFDAALAEEPVAEAAFEPAVVAEAIALEAALLPEPEAVAIADEPARLPLSQLLRLVSDWTTAPSAPTAAPETEPLADEPAPLEAHATEPAAFETEAAEPLAAPAPVSEPDDLDLDPVAAQALEELSRQLPPASLADGIPAEGPVPVVEMQTFETLDAIASQLAAAPLPKHDSLDDLASLFAATPPLHAGPLTSGLDAPSSGRRHEFASLFAEPASAESAAPIEVPGVDPSLFASTVAQSPTADPLSVESLLPKVAVAESYYPEPVAVEAALAAPVLIQSLREPVIPVVAERVPAEPVLTEPVLVAPPAAETVLIEPILVQPVPAEPVLTAPPSLKPVLEQVLAGTTLPEIEVLEPAGAEWETEAVDRSWAPAAPKPFDEEIALDVDAFDPTVPAPAPESAVPAGPSFSFTFVEGFGDAWSDFDVPSVAAVAADFGLPPSGPMTTAAAETALNPTDWPAATPAGAAAPAPEATAAPVLDDEALSLIGDAAHKASLDALVIDEFERGVRGVTKPKPKKAHAGATHVAPAAAAPAAKKKGPVQDEWGLFDPEQCGFAALEEEDTADRRKTRDGTRVRVISY